PSASITLQSAAGMSCSGHAGVCFKPPTGQGFEDMQGEVVKLLAMDGTGGFRKAEDTYGYHWLVVENADIEELVTQIHLVNSSLADSGWGPQLLCSVFGLALLSGPAALSAPEASGAEAEPGGVGSEAGGADTPATSGLDAPPDALPEATAGPGRVLPSSAYLVYLFKRGTFYPFVPESKEHRNLEEELKLKSLVANDLTVEADLDRWFPLWDLPVG
ncbi:MAG: PspA-associated protein PspAB, partial [Acidimicrobiales bacterium]